MTTRKSEWVCPECKQDAKDIKDEFGDFLPHCQTPDCYYFGKLIPNYTH